MSQRTLVLSYEPARAGALEQALQREGWELRPAPHAYFSAKGAGTVVTLYRSGKLVVQGADPQAFVAAHAQLGLASATPRESPKSTGTDEATVVGSDESGKGDYFGPLVVAAVRLDAATRRKLENGPVRDCKLMSDDSVLRVGAALRSQLPFSVQRLDPPEYNAEHARQRNLNPMLAALHARAIGALAHKGMHVVVDQFAAEAVLERALAPLDVRLLQRFRGEEELAVAAASVIAREEFLLALQELSRQWALDLAKGAGAPTDRAARRFVDLHGVQALGQVAKLHFRTTHKLFGADVPGAPAAPRPKTWRRSS